MTHTHTFEMNVNSMNIEGELTFGPHAAVSITSGLDAPMAEFVGLEIFLKALHKFHACCNNQITTIEIHEKP